jgi:hypothetical protein
MLLVMVLLNFVLWLLYLLLLFERKAQVVYSVVHSKILRVAGM